MIMIYNSRRIELSYMLFLGIGGLKAGLCPKSEESHLKNLHFLPLDV